MTKEIAWIGTDFFNTEVYRETINKYLRVNFKEYRDAGAAWRGNAENEFDLIIVEPYLTLGNYHIEELSWRSNPNLIGLDLVGRIHQLNKKTPIIAISVGHGGEDELGYHPQELFDAGASEVVGLLDTNPNDFYKIVERYLNKK